MTTAITVYGCAADEATLVEVTAARWALTPTITPANPSERTAGLAAGTRCISVGHQSRIGPETLAALARVGVAYISTRSVGLDHIDTAAAASLGITVEPVAYSPDSVADYTLMLMLMAVRNARTTILRSAVHDYRLPEGRGRELRDLTVGVVGTGRIGAAVIERLRGFGCRILAHDIRPEDAGANVPLADLLQRSDIVTLHTPLTTGTHHLLDRERIGRMRRGALVVNAGRGGLIDTASLVEALERGDLGGASLDVVEDEEGIFSFDWSDRPLPHDLLVRLHRLPNVTITPHTAFSTDHSLVDMVENSLRNCLRHERTSNGATDDRRPVRGVLRGAPDLREVGARGRPTPRYREVRAPLHRDHDRG